MGELVRISVVVDVVVVVVVEVVVAADDDVVLAANVVGGTVVFTGTVDEVELMSLEMHSSICSQVLWKYPWQQSSALAYLMVSGQYSGWSPLLVLHR